MKGRGLILAAIAATLLQIGFLVWTIQARANLLRDGREIVLAVEPVDPRDLLRGDYVALSYAISRIPVSLLVDGPPAEHRRVGAVTVRLRPGEDGIWLPISAFLGEPATPASAEEVDISGHSNSWGAHNLDILRVEYGIERFYLPEGEGKPIERDLGLRPFRMHVAVGEGGRAQIKSFRDGETLIYLEPLY